MAPVVTGVRAAEHDGYTRFVVDLSASVKFTVDTLIEPFGLQIDLPELNWQSAMTALPKSVGILRDFHYSAPKPGGGQLVLETSRPVAVKKIFLIPPAEDGNWRLVVDLEATASRRLSGIAMATEQPFLGTLQPGQPLPQAGQAPAFNLTIEAPRRSPVPRAAEDLSFEAKDVVIAGVTAYRPEEIRPLVSPLIGKRIGLTDLVAAAERIEAKYHDDGYILSTAFVPPQSVADGQFRIAVVEGYVAAVSVKGGDEAARHQVEALMVGIPASRPLKISAIETALVAANAAPGVTASGLLRPSETEPGASDFVVTVETMPFTAALSVDNRGSKTTGLWTISADVAARSPLGDGGQVLLNAAAAPDVNQRRSLQGKYVVPVGTGGLTASLSGLLSHGEPGGSASQLRLISDSSNVGTRLTYPLLLDRQDRLLVEGGFTVQSADVHALNQPFSHDEWRTLDLALIYQDYHSLDGASSLTIDYSRGLPALGASPSGSQLLSRPGGSTDFSKLSAMLSHLRQIDGPLSLFLSAKGQYGLNRLLTGEEVSFGGAGPGRGYDPGALTGDSGIGGSVELRYDLDAADLSLDQTQLYGFYDAAKVWLHDGSIAQDKLGSAGLGLRTGFDGHYTLGAEFAHAFIPLATSDSGKRDNRLLFNGSARF